MNTELTCGQEDLYERIGQQVAAMSKPQLKEIAAYLMDMYEGQPIAEDSDCMEQISVIVGGAILDGVIAELKALGVTVV